MSYFIERPIARVGSFGLLFCALLVLVCFPSIRAQGGGVDQTGTGGQHAIQGRIYFPSGRRSDIRVMVKLENYNAGGLSVLSDSNGTFKFTGLTPGSYVVVVDGGEEYETVREAVNIESEGVSARTGVTMPVMPRRYTVDISLQPKQNNSAKPGVINAALAAVPQAARDLYQQALRDSQAGDSNKAIDELRSALAFYPEFPLALNELGVQYLKHGQADRAADALGKAVKLAPQDFLPRLHLGIALLNQRRFADAEDALRSSITLNNSPPTAHMYLGMVLAIQRKLSEGEKELKIAIDSRSAEVALAHRYLGGIFLERHEYALAANELETYLKSFPKAADADVLRQKIRELRSKT
jgi:Tfp pilus assembly protein PilF